MKEESLYNALIRRLGELVKENVELEQRVHQLMADYNNVVRQTRGEEKETPQQKEKHLLDLCTKLEMERDCAKNNYDDLYHLTRQHEGQLDRFEQSEFLPVGCDCPYNPTGNLKVGSGRCVSCSHFMKMDLQGKTQVLCAYTLDKKRENDSCQQKSADE